jgi:predicted dehydrogenase
MRVDGDWKIFMALKVRIGFIGAGGIAPGHWRRLHETKIARVVALNDPSDESLRKFYAKCPGAELLPVYGDYREMLRREQLDAVLILSPHTVHFRQATDALNRGLHVLCEKPMTCCIKHANLLMRTAEKAGRTLMISYQRHFDPAFRYMRQQIAAGNIGEIQYVQALQCQEWLRLTRGTWRQKISHSGGGQLNDSGSHLVDIMMWVTGLRISEVFASQVNFKTEVDINSSLAMKFSNGAIGSMSIVGNAPGWYEDHTIVGDRGALFMRQNGKETLVHQDAMGKQVKVRLPKYSKNPDSNFIDCILGKDEPQTPPQCGLRTIEVTEAAWKSAAAGRPIALKH